MPVFGRGGIGYVIPVFGRGGIGYVIPVFGRGGFGYVIPVFATELDGVLSVYEIARFVATISSIVTINDPSRFITRRFDMA